MLLPAYRSTRPIGCLSGFQYSSLILVATLVQGLTNAHLVEVVTVGTQVATVSEDCGLVNGLAVCTIVNQAPGTTSSAVLTATPGASDIPVVTGIPVGGNGTATSGNGSGTKGNGAQRRGVATFSALAVVVAGVVVGATMV